MIELFTKLLVHNDKLWEYYRKGLSNRMIEGKKDEAGMLDFKIADDELLKK